MKVLVFGQLKEFTGSEEINIPTVASTMELKAFLAKTFPGIDAINFLIAVDKEVIQQDTQLTDENTIALLPPYAGG